MQLLSSRLNVHTYAFKKGTKDTREKFNLIDRKEYLQHYKIEMNKN